MESIKSFSGDESKLGSAEKFYKELLTLSGKFSESLSGNLEILFTFSTHLCQFMYI